MLVTNDSGPAHFAALTRIHVIVLFGPEIPERYRPLASSSDVIHTGYSCSPCIGPHNQRLSPCNDNLCMKSINVRDVSMLVRSRLAAARAERWFRLNLRNVRLAAVSGLIDMNMQPPHRAPHTPPLGVTRLALDWPPCRTRHGEFTYQPARSGISERSGTPISKALHQFADRMDELRWVDGFGDVQLKARRECSVAVVRLSVRRQGHCR